MYFKGFLKKKLVNKQESKIWKLGWEDLWGKALFKKKTGETESWLEN